MGLRIPSAVSYCQASPSGEHRSFVMRKYVANYDDGDDVCDPNLVHIAITLDEEYLRGPIAAVHSVLRHALCPESIYFHFLVLYIRLGSLVRSVFPMMMFKVYYFDEERVSGLISPSVRQALEQPLNYARNYLAGIVQP